MVVLVSGIHSGRATFTSYYTVNFSKEFLGRLNGKGVYCVGVRVCILHMHVDAPLHVYNLCLYVHVCEINALVCVWAYLL